MTDTERDKISQTIHEARGLCWHIYDDKKSALCLKCKSRETFWDEDRDKNRNLDYTADWTAWGAALEWAKGKEGFPKFLTERILSYSPNTVEEFLSASLNAMLHLLNPELGSAALTKFIDENPKYFEKEVGR